MILRARSGRVLRLDGGMGTALLDRGLPAGVLPEAWVIERPWEVESVHRDHVAAGAELLLTCTFNLARLDTVHPSLDPADVARRAVALARSARPERVAGCAGATGLVRPGSTAAPPDAIAERYAVAFRALAAAGADLLWLETQVDLGEARAGLAAGLRTGLPVVVTAFLVPGPGGMTALDGSPGEEFLRALWRDGAAAVGVNCVSPDAALARIVAATRAVVPGPIAVKPNAGLPGQAAGTADFAAGVAGAVRAGATLAGGCCGTGPSHLRALGRLLAPQARG